MSHFVPYLSFAKARRISSAILVVLLTCAWLPSLRAQVATAAINGTVTDSSGAVIPGANVTLKNVATNVERSTVTNEAGNYALLNVPPGRYTLQVSKEGFTAASQEEFQLYVNQTTTFDFALRVGSAKQTVTVEATAAALQTSTSELGSVITTRAVNDLPLNGRNFTQMLNLTPGVSTVNVAQNGGSQLFIGNSVGSFSFPSINGQTNRSNFFLTDGLNNQESFGSTYSVPPIIDDIQEFKVDSHNDQAQFGGVLGGVVNVVTKSGTNDFRGEAWEFMRNNALDARNPFVDKTTQLQQNQFGANIGGPVILPHYNGRNRTFFYGSYEGVRIHTGNPNQSLVPTAAQINGDLSSLGVQLYSPWSTSTTGTGVRDPFRCVGGAAAPLIPGTKLQDQTVGTPCSILPAGLIDTNMQNVAQLLYGKFTPNLTGIPNRNYQQVLLNTQSPDSYNIRVDEQLSAKDAIWGRFSHTSSPRDVPNIFGAFNANAYNAHTYGVTWNHTFGPSALLTVQFGRNYGFSVSPTLLPESASQALIKAGNWDPSFSCSYTRGPRSCYFTGASLGSFASFSEGTAPSVTSDIWQWKGNLFKSRGRHQFSVGADFNTNGFQQTFNTGNLSFSQNQTANAASGGSGGNDFASFLLGIPNALNYRNLFETEYGGWVDGFYFQDQWRVTDRLTVNLGARYDVSILPIYGSDKDGNAPVGDMDYTTGNYVIQRVPPNTCNSTLSNPPCLPNGKLPDHVTVSSNGHFWQSSYDNIQPRLGLAYRLRDKTVLRTSFGRFFDNWAAVIQMAQNQQGAWPSVGQISFRQLNQDPGPPTVLAENPGVSLFLDATPYRQSNWFVDPNLQNPYSYQWNFGVQQALSQNTTLTVNYVGSTDHRLDVGVQGNQALRPGPGPAPNGCQGIMAPGCVDKTTGQNIDNTAAVAAQGRWLFPYLAPSRFDKSIGKGYYHALQVSLDKKTSHGLSYLLAYTWSKTISLGADEWFNVNTAVQDPYHLDQSKALAGFDLPQILNVSFVWEMPFGRGRKFQTGNRPFDAVLGGWQLNGITSFTSGRLFNVTASNAIPNVGQSGVTEFANLCGNPSLANPTPAQWFNNAVAVDSKGNAIPGVCASGGAFAVPLPQTYGNFGRNVLRADGRANLDLSVFRSFKLTESKRLEFRAEAFNFTNSPIWGIPGSNISFNFSTNPAKNTFGVVTSTANEPRIIQFALKLYY